MTIIKVPERFLTITDIFQKLHRYLYNSHPFMMRFNHNYCRYVNFYFNKLINPLYSEEDKKEYFSLFHKFGNEFQIIKGTKDTCLPYLYYINPDIFTKINLLYELYDKYSTCDEFMKSQTESACDKLRSFRFLYNEIIRKYDGNANKLIEKLIELKKLIGQNIFSPNTKICGEHVTYFNEPVKYLEEKDKEKKRLESLEEELLRAQRQQQQQKKQQEQMKESSGYKHTQTEDETQSPEQLLSSKPQEVQGSPVITEQSHPHVNKLVQGLSAYPGIPKVEPSPYKQEMEENEVEKHGIHSFKNILMFIILIKKKFHYHKICVINSLNTLLNISILQLEPSLEEEEDVIIESLVVSLERTQVFQNIMMVILETCLLIYHIRQNRIYSTIISDKGNLFIYVHENNSRILFVSYI
ncbi:hypothetical protein PVBG_06211 [Plasmodium vivax Brazil I]|uniref:Uncharacterized protein n=1 Tax=Plasmodium vivax (strain Brazil I) TaxID=1033975 RepID=A0A0J9SL46_PLAV1|nr:hypothetical protein PVBG_06211 [Plasmodium vivax Brazil I]